MQKILLIISQKILLVKFIKFFKEKQFSFKFHFLSSFFASAENNINVLSLLLYKINHYRKR